MSDLTNPTAAEVRQFLNLGEGDEKQIYHDDAIKGYPTHGLGVNLQGKSRKFLLDYITNLGMDPLAQVNHYVFNGTTWVVDSNAGKKYLVDEILWLCNETNTTHRPFDTNSPIANENLLMLNISNKPNASAQAFDQVVYQAYLGGTDDGYNIEGVRDIVNDSIWEKLTKRERLALYSLNYNSPVGSKAYIGSGTLSALNLYTNGSSTSQKFIGKLGVWYQILYCCNSEPANLNHGTQNRRFLEANEFLEIPNNFKPDSASEAQSIIPINSYEEANIAIAFMNQNKDAMKNKLDDITNYKNNSYKYIRDNFSSAVSAFLSNQNYTQGYNINTLFTEWNLYTDLQINTSTGTTSYGDITGSDKRDLVFITGGEENTEVNTGKGDDEIYGTDAREIINSGNDDDYINAGGGNNLVNGGSGNDTIIAGSGNDTIYCGTGRDYVDAGLGENHIYLGDDNSNDKIYIRGGVNYIYNYSEYDYIELASGLHIVSALQPENSKNIVFMLSGGGEIILVDAAKDEPPAEPDPSDPYIPEAAEEMPYIVFPNGNIMGWAPSLGEYVDTGYKLPPLEGGKLLPDNGESVIPQIPVPTDDTPPQKPTLKPDDRDPHDLPENEDAPAGSLNDPKSHKLPWNKQPYSGTRLSNVPISWYLPQTPIPEKAQGGFEGSQQDPSPLVLDLDGDGIETISTEEKVYFDHDNSGFAENTGWVSKDDGLLVRDLNNNGKIDNGTELFGNNTPLNNGQKAANGFEALKDLDSNSDGVFNGSDTAWNQVKVWKDTNQNGKVDEGELLTLEQAA